MKHKFWVMFFDGTHWIAKGVFDSMREIEEQKILEELQNIWDPAPGDIKVVMVVAER